MAQIYSTTDYSKFRKLKGNRDVEPASVRMLVNSIKQIGWISNPIIVNDKMEIIDGQTRFEALKKLGMPIEYNVVKTPNGLNVCRVMNNRVKKWNTGNYVDSYAETGAQDYRRIKQLMEYYDVSLDVVALAKDAKTKLHGNSGKDYRKMREGNLEFSECDFVEASRILSIYVKYRKIFERFTGRTNNKDRAIMYIIHYGEKYGTVDHDKVIECLDKCDPKTIYNTSFDRLLESIQNAYNYNKAKKNRLYFYEEYRLDNKI